mgnify:FL=1
MYTLSYQRVNVNIDAVLLSEQDECILYTDFVIHHDALFADIYYMYVMLYHVT